MIRVTIWNEHFQDRGIELAAAAEREGKDAREVENLRKMGEAVRAVHPEGINETLKTIFDDCDDIQVTLTGLDEPDCGLSEELLSNTDVLLYWAHCTHDQVSDEAAERVRQHVLRGMGFIPLHSAHPSKPMQRVLGSSGALRWRDGDYCRIFVTAPTHPIAAGIPDIIELGEEEMYGEYFDIAKPDDVVFTSWFSGGDVFRSGCTWTRGFGRIFYFQPGHETNRSYYHPVVSQIIKNAVYWCAPVRRVENLDCPHTVPSFEEIRGGRMEI